MKRKIKDPKITFIKDNPKTVYMTVLQYYDNKHEFFKMNLGSLYVIEGALGCGNTSLAQKMCLAKMQHDVQTKIRIVDTDNAYKAFAKSIDGELVIVDSHSGSPSHNWYSCKSIVFNFNNSKPYSEELIERLVDIIRRLEEEMSTTEEKYVVVIDSIEGLPDSPLSKSLWQTVNKLLMVAKNTQSKIIIVTYDQALEIKIPEYYKETVVCKYYRHSSG